MNNASQCIFDLSHVLKHLRDTLEFVLPKDQEFNVYESRKKVLTSITDEKSFIGKFVKDNEEKLSQFKTRYQEFLNEIYGSDSTVVIVGNENKIRVDHTQHIKIYDYVIYLSETVRDILYSHIQFAKGKNEYEKNIEDMVALDEKFDRALKVFLILQDYQKSFSEFQKVMTESQGKPTPQSNFIVQNELSKYAQMMRFVRAHCHCTDNRTLDMIDEVIELIEMTEGRRDRRDGKPFPDFFKACLDKLAAYINEIAPKYQSTYENNLKDMLETIKKNSEAKGETPVAA